MRFKYKRSKITGMTKWGFRSGPSRGQQGMASIIVVSVLIVIMTLITIGFTRLVTRSAVNSANRQFSASATYAAQSAINDVASYIKQYAAANIGNPLLPKSTTCTGNGSLIGNSTSQGPFYSKSQLSSNTTTRYTCLLLNPTPSTLVFTQVQNLKSQVVKINTSASAGALDKLLLSWQPSDSQITGFPTSPSNLNDETTWNSSTGICKDSGGVNASCIPVLRVAIFPISNGEPLTSPQAQSKTIFLYPQGGGVNVPVKPYVGAGAISDGSLVPIPCTQHIAGAGDFNPTTNSGYVCNVILSALASAITPSGTDSVYLRITPIYNQADVRLAADDRFGNALNFINDQAIIDATAQTSGVVKRLQARADTSSLANGATSADTNIASNSNDIPEQAVRSANALCKRELLVKPSVTGFAPFVSFDDPDTVCHDQGGTPPIITQFIPTLAFSIIGNDAPDSGKRVCSTGDAPETALWGCTTSANSDSPQSPLQPGTVFITSGATLNWQSTQATACNAGVGWTGNQLTSVSGSNNTGSGSQNFSGITTVTEYDLTCTRTGTPTPTPTKKVFAWPPPRITNLSVGPSSTVPAGSDYTINWDSVNIVPDGFGPCTLSGDWSGTVGHTGSKTFTWPFADNSSTKSYTVTCHDPIGRPDQSTITVNSSGGSCTGDGCASPSGGHVVPPVICTADWNVNDNNNGTGTLTFDGACPPNNPLSGFYQFNSCNATLQAFLQSQGGDCGGKGVGNSAKLTVGVGTYCGVYSSGAAPWGTLHSSDYKCFTIAPPPVIVQYSPVGGYHYTASLGPATCHDGLHNYIFCFSWNATQNDQTYHPGQEPLGSEGGVVTNCHIDFNSSTYGSGGANYSNNNITSGNPVVWNYWNETLGWSGGLDPGIISGRITCTSSTYGNTGFTDFTYNGGFCSTAFGGDGCTSGGGTGGGGGGTGGGGSLHQASTCYDDSGNFAHINGCTSFESSVGYTNGAGCYDSSNNFVSRTGC
jgi:hypothetical protein